MEGRMTAQQLKNSILQMAVQGKLVPQDPNDEPASALLERIRQEKEQLIKEGKIKRNKNESFIFRGADNLHYEQIGKDIRCIEDELPFEVPYNWQWCKLNSVGTMVRGNGIKRTETVDSGYPCIRYGEIYTSFNHAFSQSKSYVDISLYDKCKKIKCHDLVFTLTGENKVDIAKTIVYKGEQEVAAGGDLAIWSNHSMNSEYLSYLMASPLLINQKSSSATGDIIVHISCDKVGNFYAPIPPLNEQNRIVKSLEKLTPLIEQYSNIESKLNILNQNIKEKLKKSILQYAIEGKLVEQDPNDEPVSILLDRIHDEKEKLIKEGKIKRNKNESVIFRRDNSYCEKFDDGSVACIDDEIPYAIPNNWIFIRQKDICFLYNGIKVDNEKLPYLEAKVMRNKKVPEYKDSGVIVNKGTKVILVDGENSGELMTIPYKGYMGSTFKILIEVHSINAEYLNLFFAINKDFYKNNKKGAAIPHLNKELFSSMLLPLPPIEEQARIIEKYEFILKILG